MVEGDRLNQGTYSTWYQNLANNTYWRTDQEIQNYGYYLAPVLKLGPALKALDFLTEERVEKYPRMGSSRAQALTMKAGALHRPSGCNLHYKAGLADLRCLHL